MKTYLLNVEKYFLTSLLWDSLKTCCDYVIILLQLVAKSVSSLELTNEFSRLQTSTIFDLLDDWTQLFWGWKSKMIHKTRLQLNRYLCNRLLLFLFRKSIIYIVRRWNIYLFILFRKKIQLCKECRSKLKYCSQRNKSFDINQYKDRHSTFCLGHKESKLD